MDKPDNNKDLAARSVIPFPSGDDPQITTLNGHIYNLTVLRQYNFTLYANSTLSNESDCYLLLPKYPAPVLYPNGSFVNGTSCYIPINPISTHGILGLTFGSLFALSVLFTLVNLRKHGKAYIKREKRWKAVGRRWQWYWMLFVAACGSISGFTAIDVDRDYLPGTPMILQSFFYTLSLSGALACVWEGTRQWGSYESRKSVYLEQFATSYDRHNERMDFFLPLVFYLFDWLGFFMMIPRSWTPASCQRSTEQALTMAKPMATDVRFKTGSIFTLCAWIVIAFKLIQNFRRSHQNFAALLGTKVGYAIASSWLWDVSPLNMQVQSAWVYGLGYAPTMIIILILEIHGQFTKNEDKELILLKGQLDRAVDAETHFPPANTRPRWWRPSIPMHGDHNSVQLKRFQSRRRNMDDDDDQNGTWWWQQRNDRQTDPGNVHGKNQPHKIVKGSSLLMETRSTTKLQDQANDIAASSTPSLVSEMSGESSVSVNIAALHSRPKQKVRSMLDV